MFIEEKLAEIEARLKALEERQTSPSEDTIIVKFKRDRELEMKEPTTRRVPIIMKQKEPEPEPEPDVEQEKQEIAEQLSAPVRSKNDKITNQWVTVSEDPGDESYEYNGHQLYLYVEKGTRYAQMDNNEPIPLNKKERKAFKEIEELKDQMEHKYSIR